MNDTNETESNGVAERVRANVVPCLIGAALLLYFGFDRLSEPTGTGLFERANWWFFHAVRIGGVGLAIVALWSLSGHRSALLADAAVSCPVGLVFVLAGPAMLIGGGETLNGALITLFGGMFISDGLRNGRAFLQFRRFASEPFIVMRPAVDEVPHVPVLEAPKRQSIAPVEVPAPRLEPVKEALPPSKPVEAVSGYLASFAKKPPPNSGDRPSELPKD